MNGNIRRVSATLLAAFLALLAAPLYWQVVAAERLNSDNRNVRVLYEEYSIERGRMLVRDGDRVTVVARSEETDDELKYLRVYPEGKRYGMVTGYYSHVFGRSLAEAEYNSYLLGQAPEQFAQNVADLLTARSTPGGDLLLTLDAPTQKAAEAALGEREGAVVAMDYTTGAILAMTTFPRYDPNRLATHDGEKAQEAWDQLQKDPNDPLINRATGALYPPGSTFKVITATAALQNGIDPAKPLPAPDVYDVPQTDSDIRNFGGGSCGGEIDMANALRISCNTYFARLGVEIGAGALADAAEQYGFNADPEYPLPAAKSVVPREMDVPSTAQSAIGQRDVRVTPLQMASVAATIANGGERMAPYVVSQVVASNGSVTRRFEPDSLGQAIPTDVAGTLSSMMLGVVEGGSGTRAQIPGVEVHGKTGTAQHAEGEAPHAWFIGFAEQGDRHVAVAVVVERGGDLGSEATGGRVSAPVAKAVMEAYLRGGGS